MKINLLSPSVYEIEDFITVEEQQEVLAYAKSLEESSWWSTDKKVSEFFNGKIHLGQKPEVFAQIDQKVKNLFSKVYLINPLSLNRHLKTNFMMPHTDYDPENKNIDHSVRVKYGVVLYYNDDYEGGAINYPKLGIVHKPKARSLFLHAGNILHGTTKVLDDNIRYFSTTFAFATKDVGVEFNKEIFGDIEKSDGYILF
jgi:hypothetical protein